MSPQFQDNLPGPGTYGEGGVPWSKIEEKAKKSVCTVGVMEGGIGRSNDIKNEVSSRVMFKMLKWLASLYVEELFSCVNK